jgi:hypothetical protein
MEPRHLRYFTAVAKHLNLSEASRRPTRHQSTIQTPGSVPIAPSSGQKTNPRSNLLPI